MHQIAFLASLLSLPIVAAPAFAQDAMLECHAKYHTSTTIEDDAPGMLGAFRDRPCKHSTHIGGVGARAPGSGVSRMEFAERPQHGKVSAKSPTTFVYLPDRGYTGRDSMVVRYYTKAGKRMSVRFAITVS